MTNVKQLLAGLLTDLRESRLWPVAAALVVALVAVPVLLSHNASSTEVAQATPSGLPVSSNPGVHPVTVDSSPGSPGLPRSGRDPFTQQPGSHTGNGVIGAAAATTLTSSVGAQALSGGAGGATGGGVGTSFSALATGGGSGSGGSSGGGAGGSGSGGSARGGLAIASSAPIGPPPAPHTGLYPNQSYRVALSITNSEGGLNNIDPLERLSVLPDQQQPLLVELGVLQGGNRVLFAVQPGTVVTGPGTCTPGPIDCEILSLAADQTESLALQSTSGPVPVALFAVTSISTVNHPSAAAGAQARRVASPTGRRIVANSMLGALSLFQYQPSLGVIVDLRDLTVGGS